VIRLAVRVQRAQAELVLAELLELAPTGVEEAEVGDDLVEYAVYGAAGELPSLPDLHAAAGDALVEVSTSETADDWQERWRQFHRPVLVEAPSSGAASGRPVPALRVRPPWEADSLDVQGPVEEIVLDPGQAFGTGAHATTRMCLELLLELAAAGLASGPLLDVGSGSGVLAIAAARLGFAPVLGLDHELESVEAARANAAVNRVEIAVERFDLRRQELPWLHPQDAQTPASARPTAGITMLANLLLPLLLELARTMRAAPDRLIASGLLCEQADQVSEAFSDRFGLIERRRLERGEWAALWLAAD
jgi:ribosomal protein L11 methyltransferase